MCKETQPLELFAPGQQRRCLDEVPGRSEKDAICRECGRENRRERTRAHQAVGLTQNEHAALPREEKARILADYRASVRLNAPAVSTVPTKRTRAKVQYEDTPSIRADKILIKELQEGIRDKQWLDRPFTDLLVGELYYFTIEGVEGRMNFGMSTLKAGGAADRIYAHQSSHSLFPDLPPRNGYVVSVSDAAAAEKWMFQQLTELGYTRVRWHDSQRLSEVFLNVSPAIAKMVMDQAARRWPV